MLTGRCLCGSVRYRIRGAPLSMYHCHCAQCRRACGASFATSILVRSDDYELVAGSDGVASYESSPGKERHFCSPCSSPLFSRSQALPQLLSVRCGTLDGDPGVRLSAHIYVSSKAPWVDSATASSRSRRGSQRGREQPGDSDP